ncbi:hypothetical protein ACOZ4L_12575 [Haloplanus ruber]|uniref:Uncharacterized protein n=1 Tax=Haloplanus ruber TaxID=869892 RepID=A0ABD6CZ27_9EURY|nr:hypothetical protein [Haloplanus ruber]
MDRRLALVLSATIVVLSGCAAPATPSDGTGTPTPEREYPEGAGPNHVDFAALDADNRSVADSPRDHWESYAIVYTAPPERRLVEGNYYIDSSTGAIVGERWNDGRVYIDGSTYAFVQPADSVPERERQQLDADDSFVYDAATDAYYRYDRHYGSVAPTNIGRHPDLLDAYTWEAVETTTHHGVPVVTYRATGSRPDTRGPPVVDGTLRLGVGDGVVYAFDLTVDADGEDYRYTYEVRPAPFPEHEWVDRARELSAENATAAE